VTAIHSEVDKIELLIHSGEKQQLTLLGDSHNLKSPMSDDQFWGSATPTTQNVKLRIPAKPGSSRHLGHRESQMTVSTTAELAKAAEKLASQLSATVAELKARKEESDVSSFWDHKR